jgi:hypothetical protein
MKKILFLSACLVALSTGGAFAQNQPAPGASSEGNVGPGATRQTHHMTKNMTKPPKGTTTGMATTRRGETTGMATTRRHHMAKPSSEGNVAPGTKQ